MIDKVLFIGSKELGLECLKTIYEVKPESIIGVLTIDDSEDTRGKLNDFITFCSSNNIDLKIAKSRKESEIIINEIQPDLCFVVGWYWIFPKNILDIPDYGFIGIHNSLLPKYRGGAPLVWSIIQGENRVGYTMFSFSEGMDDGDIWFQREIEINENEYISDVLERISKLIVIDLKSNYIKILNNSILPKPQDHSKSSYCALRLPEDGKINWNKDAIEIYNFIRAQAKPYPGAFTFLEDKKIVITKASYSNTKYLSTPGQVISANKEGVLIGCGNNTTINIIEVEIDGDIFNAHQIIKSLKIRLK